MSNLQGSTLSSSSRMSGIRIEYARQKMGEVHNVHVHVSVSYSTTVETGLLAHALMGSIAELYTLIFENADL